MGLNCAAEAEVPVGGRLAWNLVDGGMYRSCIWEADWFEELESGDEEFES